MRKFRASYERVYSMPNVTKPPSNFILVDWMFQWQRFNIDYYFYFICNLNAFYRYLIVLNIIYFHFFFCMKFFKLLYDWSVKITIHLWNNIYTKLRLILTVISTVILTVTTMSSFKIKFYIKLKVRSIKSNRSHIYICSCGKGLSTIQFRTCGPDQ